jgi:hypothetical protein
VSSSAVELINLEYGVNGLESQQDYLLLLVYGLPCLMFSAERRLVDVPLHCIEAQVIRVPLGHHGAQVCACRGQSSHTGNTCSYKDTTLQLQHLDGCRNSGPGCSPSQLPVNNRGLSLNMTRPIQLVCVPTVHLCSDWHDTAHCLETLAQ